MSYIEKQAKRYASKNMSKFNSIIKRFNINKHEESSNDYCDAMYKQYKYVLCIFDNIIKVSYLFEEDKESYNKLYFGMDVLDDREKFTNLYINELANIYITVFGKKHKRLGLIEKINNANEYVVQIYNCIQYRIKYHYWCENHQKNYNIDTHKHEILISVYMYDTLINIVKLLNIYQEKYRLFKKQIQKEAYEHKKKILNLEKQQKDLEKQRKDIEKQRKDLEKQQQDLEKQQQEEEEKQKEYELDNITTSSKTLSDEPFEVIPKHNKRTTRKKRK